MTRGCEATAYAGTLWSIAYDCCPLGSNLMSCYGLECVKKFWAQGNMESYGDDSKSRMERAKNMAIAITCTDIPGLPKSESDFQVIMDKALQDMMKESYLTNVTNATSAFVPEAVMIPASTSTTTRVATLATTSTSTTPATTSTSIQVEDGSKSESAHENGHESGGHTEDGTEAESAHEVSHETG